MGANTTDDCGQLDGFLRVSDDNLAFLKAVRIDMQAKGYQIVVTIDSEIKFLQDAKAKGMTRRSHMQDPPRPRRPRASPPLKGRMIILTDNLCFSACLSVVQ